MALPRLMVAPNGARKTKADHPNLPITLPEIIADAAACFDAGADGLHLHLRDGAGNHLLDDGAYREALAELSRLVPELAVQVTTEAAGVYASDHQRAIALASDAALISASIRELATDTDAKTLRRFFAECDARGLAIQHILYDVNDLALLATILSSAQLEAPDLQLLFVLGRYAENAQADAGELSDFLAQLGARKIDPDWAICAFGVTETECLLKASDAGGKMRVGFENSIWNSDGQIAKSNAERVAIIAKGAAR